MCARVCVCVCAAGFVSVCHLGDAERVQRDTHVTITMRLCLATLDLGKQLSRCSVPCSPGRRGRVKSPEPTRSALAVWALLGRHETTTEGPRKRSRKGIRQHTLSLLLPGIGGGSGPPGNLPSRIRSMATRQHDRGYSYDL